MAWLERDRTNGPFQIVFRFGNQRMKRSARTKNEREAQQLVSRVDRRLRMIEQGDLAIPDGVDVATFLISDGKLSLKPAAPSTMTLGQLFDAYRASLPPGAMESNSLYTANIHMNHISGALGSRFTVRSLTLAELQRYVQVRSRKTGRRGKPISPTTIKKELATFSSIWSFARENGYVETVFPNKGLKFPKSCEKPRFQTWAEIERQIDRDDLSETEQDELWDCLYLTLDEVEQFLAHVREHARHDFLFPMIALAAYTGARKSELIRSQVADVDLNSSLVTIREKKRNRERHTTRQVPLSQQARGVIESWLNEHPGGRSTFCIGDISWSKSQREAPEPLTRDQAHDHFKQTLKGTRWEKIRGWHVLRHSFASNCAARGVDQRIINRWMGHQTEDMVKRYQHLLPNAQQAAIDSVFG